MIYDLVKDSDPLLQREAKDFQFKTAEDFEKAQEYQINLLESLKHYDGLGLASNQVGIDFKIIVMQKKDGEYITCFNPFFVAIEEDGKSKQTEGCLSFPNLFLPIQRYNSIVTHYKTAQGINITTPMIGIDARVFQHETEHVYGYLYWHHFSKFQLDRHLKMSNKKTPHMYNSIYMKKLLELKSERSDNARN